MSDKVIVFCKRSSEGLAWIKRQPVQDQWRVIPEDQLADQFGYWRDVTHCVFVGEWWDMAGIHSIFSVLRETRVDITPALRLMEFLCICRQSVSVEPAASDFLRLSVMARKLQAGEPLDDI